MKTMNPIERRRRVTQESGEALGLGEFIRQRRDEIMKDWEAAVRQLPIARDLDRPALIDHIPAVLDRIVDMVDAAERGDTPQLPKEVADVHAVERIEEGFDLTQVVAEFAILRDCIMHKWQASVFDTSHLLEMRVINQAIDRAVAASVGRFTQVRDGTLIALDRIATEALESRDLDDLLGRLLQVFVETTPAADTATILIHEGDVLRVRAALGLGRESALGLTVRIGDGFEGMVAAERRPITAQNVAANPLVTNEVLRVSGVRVLYGIPLVSGGGLIGVAHMGSLTANEFSKQDKRMLSAMANRASAAIYQHMLRERTEKTAAELAAVVESIPAAVFISTNAGVLRSNCAGLALLGASSNEQLAQQRVSGLVEALEMRNADTAEPLTPDDGPMQRAVRGDHVHEDVIVHDHSNDRDLVVHTVAAPIIRDDAIIGAVSVNVDITERRQIAAALRESEGKFRTLAADNARLYQEAQQAIEAREEILAIVSHDLRNPLGAIDLGADLALRSATLEPATRKQLEAVRRAAKRMEHLLRDLLDTASIQVGRLALQRIPEQASTLLADVIEAHTELAKTKGIELIQECALAGRYICCDRDRLTQAFSNLIGNAIKFCHRGEVVTVRGAVDGDRVTFTVADTGPGIATHELPHIFRPYWSAKHHAQKGTGLGLYIAKGIVEGHGGSLSVDSKLGAGTSFTVALPLAAGPNGPC